MTEYDLYYALVGIALAMAITCWGLLRELTAWRGLVRFLRGDAAFWEATSATHYKRFLAAKLEAYEANQEAERQRKIADAATQLMRRHEAAAGYRRSGQSLVPDDRVNPLAAETLAQKWCDWLTKCVASAEKRDDDEPKGGVCV